jgi:hypothetical protein
MAAQSVSTADRIRELTDINSDVVAILTSAGLAINALTNRPLNATSDDDNDTNMETLDARKQAFERNTKDFYENVHAVTARLRRQAYALQEAGIITPEAFHLSSISVKSAKPPPTQAVRGAPQQVEQQPERITNGGLGKQDIGILNSRGNRVGADKEKELVEDAKKLIQDA